MDAYGAYLAQLLAIFRSRQIRIDYLGPFNQDVHSSGIAVTLYKALCSHTSEWLLP